MSIICPTVLAKDAHAYHEQLKKVLSFAERIQIDLTDGEFVSNRTVDISHIQLPHKVPVDLHLMYQKPMEYLHTILRLRPHMVIVHAEAHVHHMHFAAELHKEDIRVGLAILPDTPFKNIDQVVSSFDHALIFSGHLGHFGGQADLGLLDKVKQIKDHHPEIEIGWDGGVNTHNAKALADGGVDVLNVGGFIQKAENPKQAYLQLVGALHSRGH